jgi:hypothetical protein
MRGAVGLAGAAALAIALLPGTGAATGNEPGHIVVEDGLTQPVFSYENAIREVVQVTSPVSSHDGDEPDIIVVDIIRPAASNDGLKVPTIIIPSPYYSGPGRGGTVNRAGERKPTPPATPSIVAGDRHFGGNRLTGYRPVIHALICGPLAAQEKQTTAPLGKLTPGSNRAPRAPLIRSVAMT